MPNSASGQGAVLRTRIQRTEIVSVAPSLHRVRERLVSQRTGVINQIRAFLLERGIAVRKGLRPLRTALPQIVLAMTDKLSPRMLYVIEALAARTGAGSTSASRPCRARSKTSRAGQWLPSGS